MIDDWWEMTEFSAFCFDFHRHNITWLESVCKQWYRQTYYCLEVRKKSKIICLRSLRKTSNLKGEIIFSYRSLENPVKKLLFCAFFLIINHFSRSRWRVRQKRNIKENGTAFFTLSINLFLYMFCLDFVFSSLTFMNMP